MPKVLVDLGKSGGGGAGGSSVVDTGIVINNFGDENSLQNAIEEGLYIGDNLNYLSDSFQKLSAAAESGSNAKMSIVPGVDGGTITTLLGYTSPFSIELTNLTKPDVTQFSQALQLSGIEIIHGIAHIPYAFFISGEMISDLVSSGGEEGLAMLLYTGYKTLLVEIEVMNIDTSISLTYRIASDGFGSGSGSGSGGQVGIPVGEVDEDDETSLAIGKESSITGSHISNNTNGIAIGYKARLKIDSQSSGYDSVAIGSGAIAESNRTVSFDGYYDWQPINRTIEVATLKHIRIRGSLWTYTVDMNEPQKVKEGTSGTLDEFICGRELGGREAVNGIITNDATGSGLKDFRRFEFKLNDGTVYFAKSIKWEGEVLKVTLIDDTVNGMGSLICYK